MKLASSFCNRWYSFLKFRKLGKSLRPLEVLMRVNRSTASASEVPCFATIALTQMRRFDKVTESSDTGRSAPLLSSSLSFSCEGGITETSLIVSGETFEFCGDEQTFREVS